MKPYPWKCGKCRNIAVSPVVLPSYVADLEHDGRKYQVTLADLEVLQCTNCDTIILDDVANRSLSSALRSAAGLLSPAEIRDQREALGFRQKDLAGFLQISESTLSRWETGAQIQQRCMDKMLRAFFAVPELRQFLGVPEPAVKNYGPLDGSHTIAQSLTHWNKEMPQQAPIIAGDNFGAAERTPTLRLAS